jgi:hypothetical protein
MAKTKNQQNNEDNASTPIFHATHYYSLPSRLKNYYASPVHPTRLAFPRSSNTDGFANGPPDSPEAYRSFSIQQQIEELDADRIINYHHQHPDDDSASGISCQSDQECSPLHPPYDQILSLGHLSISPPRFSRTGIRDETDHTHPGKRKQLQTTTTLSNHNPDSEDEQPKKLHKITK